MLREMKGLVVGCAFFLYSLWYFPDGILAGEPGGLGPYIVFIAGALAALGSIQLARVVNLLFD